MRFKKFVRSSSVYRTRLYPDIYPLKITFTRFWCFVNQISCTPNLKSYEFISGLLCVQKFSCLRRAFNSVHVQSCTLLWPDLSTFLCIKCPRNFYNAISSSIDNLNLVLAVMNWHSSWQPFNKSCSLCILVERAASHLFLKSWCFCNFSNDLQFLAWTYPKQSELWIKFSCVSQL